MVEQKLFKVQILAVQLDGMSSYKSAMKLDGYKGDAISDIVRFESFPVQAK